MQTIMEHKVKVLVQNVAQAASSVSEHASTKPRIMFMRNSTRVFSLLAQYFLPTWAIRRKLWRATFAPAIASKRLSAVLAEIPRVGRRSRASVREFAKSGFGVVTRKTALSFAAVMFGGRAISFAYKLSFCGMRMTWPAGILNGGCVLARRTENGRN